MNMVFDRLFGVGQHRISIDGDFFAGTATAEALETVIIGTCNKAAIGSSLALKVADAILRTVREDINLSSPPRTILFLVDTQGQQLSRHEELLGLNGYFAHVASCCDLARLHDHRLVTVIHGEAVSGGFLAFGLMADRICALPDAQVRVMDLRAMAKVTKIPFDKLVVLAEESPVFAPGAENYWRMGAVDELWSIEDDWNSCLKSAITLAKAEDGRARLGLERGGRTLAAPIAELVLST
jgi:malonate decarboxylase gamma subunit